MRLQCHARCCSVRNTKAGALTTHKIVLSDLGGRPLVEHDWSNLFIGGAVPCDEGPETPA
jgi:hypothetical protein